MKVLVAGAGETGAHVIQQLQKNSRIQVVVLDPRDNPDAVQRGVIESIDVKEALTPLTFDFVLKNIQPDIVILAFNSEDMGLGTMHGMDLMASALREELASISGIPVIQASTIN